jgi:hypothetical protein
MSPEIGVSVVIFWSDKLGLKRNAEAMGGKHIPVFSGLEEPFIRRQ